MKLKKQLYILIISCLFIGAAGKKYGHLPYPQADKTSLVVVGKYADGRKKYATKEAYTAFKKMKTAAIKDGVTL